MNLTLWNRRPTTILSPFNGDIARLRDELDRTFDRFFIEPFSFGMIEPKEVRSEGWLPALDMSESDAEVTIRAEAPGVPASDLDISISGTTLTISGEKQQVTERKDENLYCCERRFGAFRRAIELPETIDADRVTAEADNGVVTIHIGKKPGTKAKRVEVKPTGKKVAVSTS